MPDQIIEFTSNDGETFSAVKARAVGSSAAPKTANSVAAVSGQPGLFRATFTDQGLSTGLWRFWGEVASAFVGQGLVNITAAEGTFREAVEAIASVDTSGLVDQIVAGINAEGVTIKEFAATALAQISARGIVVSSPSISTKRLKVYVGTVHSIAGGTAWTWTDPTGQFPAGGTWRIELFQNDAKAAEGTVSLISGEPNESQVYAGEMTATETADMTSQTGSFFVIQQLAGEDFLRWYGVAEMVRGRKPS